MAGDQISGVLISDGRNSILLYPPQRGSAGSIQHDVEIVAGPFKGRFEASAYEDPWVRVRDELVALSRTLYGKAAIEPTYLNFRLTLEGNGSRRITVSVDTQTFAIDAPPAPIYLNFSFYIDAAQLPAIIRQVEQFFLAP